MRLVTNSDTWSAILLPSPPPVTHPSSSILAVIDAKQTWAHHRHYNRHQRQMRFKFDYSQLFRNMHFIFNFVFIFIFSIFCIRISFSFSLSFSSHAIPHSLIPFGFVTFPVRFRFRFDFDSFSACVFFCFLLVHSSGFCAGWAALSSGRLHLFDWNWFLVSRWGFETRLKNHNNHNHIVWHCIVL